MNDTAALRSDAVAIEGLHHYTISVADLAASAAWYRDVLGFRLIYRSRHHAWGQVGYLQSPGYPAFLLEMFQVPDPAPLPPYAGGPQPDDDLMVSGHKHFALRHASMAEATTHIQSLGARVIDHKIVTLEGVGEFKAVFMADNTGALLEMPEDGAEGGGRAVATGEGPLAVKGLHHIAVCVQDRDEALAWYARVFGFGVASTFEIPHVGIRSAMMQAPDFWLEIHSKAGNAPVPESRRTPHADLQTLGNKYFAFGVEDVATAVQQLKHLEVNVMERIPSAVTDRLFISDPAGNPIELFQLIN